MSNRMVVSRLIWHEDGSAAIIFNDGRTEERRPDADGNLDLSDLWFQDASTGEIVQWSEDMQLTPGGVVRL